MSSFVGKVCVVTGASSGIGYQTAFDLASEGARVCVVARRKERLEEATATDAGSGHSLAVTDVSDRNEVRSLVDHVRDEHGRCDVLINNAGFSKERPLLEDGAVDDLKAMMDTNFYGTVYCTAEFLPLLIGSAPFERRQCGIDGRPAGDRRRPRLLRVEVRRRWLFRGAVFPTGRQWRLRERGRAGPHTDRGFPSDPRADRPRPEAHPGQRGSGLEGDPIGDRGRKMERVVPRWYYALQLPRIVAPPLYRLIQRKLVTPNKQDHRHLVGAVQLNPRLPVVPVP